MTTITELLLPLHFLLLLLLCCVSPSSLLAFNNPVVDLVACRPNQIQALTQFKNEFDTRGCNDSDSLNGVWCDKSTGAITKLQLNACLNGTLKSNSSLFKFHHLRDLDLSNNNFISSSLPSEFGNLNRLEVLFLYSNGFQGQVPSSFSNLSMLSFLDISENELVGSFPFVRNLSKLTLLQLSRNHLSGTLNPNSSLFELHHLTYLDLYFNNFISSSVPYEFGNLSKLEILSLTSTGFVGQVPPTISNLTLLTELYLDTNDLSGSFSLVQNLTNLFLLELAGNHFSGTIPPSLFNMPFLSRLDLHDNHFTDPIEVPNSSFSFKLEHLLLGNSDFKGKILKLISKLINLKELDLAFLNTSYPINLSLFSSLKSLLHLELSGNNISPVSLSSDSYIPLSLEVFLLNQCDISEFPNILKTLHNLEIIEITQNRINGEIPEWLWRLPRLSTMFISDNLLTGFEGSSEILVNSSVQMLEFTSNSFEETLPSLPLSINIFSAKNNRFKGAMPLSICNRSSLDYLSLSNNNFTGPIPHCLSNLKILGLRKNNLEGSIPDVFYADAPLHKLDVGYNRLTGKLPRSLLNCSSLQFLVVDNNRIKDIRVYEANEIRKPS